MSSTTRYLQKESWDILPNGLLSEASLTKLKEIHKQSDKEMKAYQNSQEFKDYSQQKDRQLNEELQVLRQQK